MAEHNKLGAEGEKLASDYLRAEGLQVVTSNYTFKKGQIDLIARENDTIVIIEVKTRSTPDFGDPQEFLKKAQIRRLVETANHFMETHETYSDCEVRFDFIGIIKNRAGLKVEHIRDAFYHFL